VSRNEIFFLSVGDCAYNESHAFYEIAKKLANLPLPYYKTLMKNATKIVVSDSSFFCMGLNLDIENRECYYYPTNRTNYDYLYKDLNHSEIARPVFRNLFEAIELADKSLNAYYSPISKSIICYKINSINTHHGMVQMRADLIDDHKIHDVAILYDSSLNASIVASSSEITDCKTSHINIDHNYSYIDSQDSNEEIPFIGGAFLPELCKWIGHKAAVTEPKRIFSSTTWISKSFEKLINSNYCWPIDYDTQTKYPLHLVSFASSNIEYTLHRIMHQANSSKFFKTITGYTENDICEYIALHKEFFNNNKRIFGYGIWKPYIIKKTLEKIPEGEFLLYSDAGSSINPMAITRLNEYITMCMESPHKNVCMHIESHSEGKFQEQNWTKEDVLAFFNLSDENRKSPQNCGGFWLIQKCPQISLLVDKWLELVSNYSMWDDSPSMLTNHTGFGEHSHDQSMLSCLLKTHGTCIIEKNEFDVGEDSWKYPFWATRIRNYRY
jgi:hypothetical protein